MRDFLLSYDTVTLRPKRSKLTSRDNADTSLVFCGKKFNLPVVPANMRDVISVQNAEWLSKNGYFYIYHRFGNDHEESENCLSTVYFLKRANHDNWPLISISVGVGETSKKDVLTAKALRLRVDFITIDVAHAHHENIKPMIDFIRESLPETKLIVGNVATGDGVAYLCELGVDAIKVGVGGGSICTTRYMTGFHLPTLQSVYEAEEVMAARGWDIPIIADGGAKHFGDVAKALVFGANMVMSGGWFAACIDSPAKIVDGRKVYRGSTSYELKGHHRHVEGIKLELVEGATYQERLLEIKDAIRSSISYAGGEDLGAFDFVDWERILPFH
jgi:GMP reductase